MEKLNKEMILNIYNKISIILGLAIFLVLFMYFNKMPESMFGTVDKGIFSLDFAVDLSTTTVVFNTPLIWFIFIFLINLGLLLYTQLGEKVTTGRITESVFYNTILSFLLIIAQLVFFYIIPESINGTISIELFQYEFVELADKSITGINFAYILASIYVFYNMVILYLEMKNNQIDYK